MLLRSTLIFNLLLFGCCRKPAEVIRTSAVVHTDRQVVTAGSLTELTLPDLCDSAGLIRRFALRDSATRRRQVALRRLLFRLLPNTPNFQAEL